MWLCWKRGGGHWGFALPLLEASPQRHRLQFFRAAPAGRTPLPSLCRHGGGSCPRQLGCVLFDRPRATPSVDRSRAAEARQAATVRQLVNLQKSRI